MREIKFRAWDKQDNKMYEKQAVDEDGYAVDINGDEAYSNEPFRILMQYTGLKDKNGVEIYELCELNNKYRVLFKDLKYVLQDISNGDIIDMEFNSKLYEITREYSPI
jgi:hypothetical protein